MGKSYLSERLEGLRQVQNPDGGWGYHTGKQSWVEPTFYASLALHGEPAADRAWALLLAWQQSDGSWPPAAKVDVAAWGTALCVTLAQLRGERGEPFQKGLAWLLRTEGVESGLVTRALARMGRGEPSNNAGQRGWPWTENTASFVEPTAHALVALKNASRVAPSDRLTERIRLGEGKLLGLRSADGGWNGGQRAAPHETLPPDAENTALGLLGLQGRQDLDTALDLAARWRWEWPSPRARAWLTVALRLHGRPVAAKDGSPAGSREIALLAVQALAAPEGNYHLLSTEAGG